MDQSVIVKFAVGLLALIQVPSSTSQQQYALQCYHCQYYLDSTEGSFLGHPECVDLIQRNDETGLEYTSGCVGVCISIRGTHGGHRAAIRTCAYNTTGNVESTDQCVDVGLAEYADYVGDNINFDDETVQFCVCNTFDYCNDIVPEESSASTCTTSPLLGAALLFLLLWPSVGVSSSFIRT